jgi:hypothetical protein
MTTGYTVPGVKIHFMTRFRRESENTAFQSRIVMQNLPAADRGFHSMHQIGTNRLSEIDLLAPLSAEKALKSSKIFFVERMQNTTIVK